MVINIDVDCQCELVKQVSSAVCVCDMRRSVTDDLCWTGNSVNYSLNYNYVAK